MKNPMPRCLILALVLLASRPSPAPTVTVTATDYAFDAPDTIPAGPTTFRFLQRGSDYHEMTVIRLAPGVTLADITREVAAKQPLTGITELGGVAAIAPHAEASATIDLAPGNYLLVCGVPDQAGVPHAAKGMIRALTVVAPTTVAASAALPRADLTITMVDYGFTFSVPLAAGSHMIRVRNTGTQPHMFMLLRLGPGKTAADVVTWDKTRQGPPPAVPLGGIAEMASGHEAFVPLDVAPGHYAVMCFADTPDGKSHLDMGMVKEVTVTAAGTH
jgi:hypothetical protein